MKRKQWINSKRKKSVRYGGQLPLIENDSIEVCNAGYRRSGDTCVLCPGNTIKTEPGDAVNCDADPPCEGTMIAGAGHTRCGKFTCVLNLTRSSLGTFCTSSF